MSTPSLQHIRRHRELGLWVPVVMVLVTAFGVWFAFNALNPSTPTTSEFGPKEMVEKYEWFKHTAAQLEKMQEEVLVYEHFMHEMCDSYGSPPLVSIESWAEKGRDRFGRWAMEIFDLKRNYDTLARKYNAEMTPRIWKFIDKLEATKEVGNRIPIVFLLYNVMLPPPPIPSKR